MVLTDFETQEEVDIQDISASLSGGITQSDIPEKKAVEEQLEANYQQALAAQTKNFGINDAPAMFMGGFGKKILKEVKKVVCSKVDENTGSDQILELVVGALTTIIPGGLLMKPVVNMVTKLIVGQGISTFCEVEETKS